MTQDALLFPHLSIRENLTYSPRADGLDDVVAALDIAHLLDRRPRHLSGGEGAPIRRLSASLRIEGGPVQHNPAGPGIDHEG